MKFFLPLPAVGFRKYILSAWNTVGAKWTAIGKQHVEEDKRHLRQKSCGMFVQRTPLDSRELNTSSKHLISLYWTGRNEGEWRMSMAQLARVLEATTAGTTAQGSEAWAVAAVTMVNHIGARWLAYIKLGTIQRRYFKNSFTLIGINCWHSLHN